MYTLITFISPLFSYLLGSTIFGFVLAKTIKGVDIREHGSMNVGATNTWRVAGKWFGIAAFLLDVMKGFFPVFIVSCVYERVVMVPDDHAVTKGTLVMVCGIAAILGHIFPVYLKFKGGKAAATSCGVFMFMAPQALAVAIVAWVVISFVSKYVSLGTMIASIAFAASVIFISDDPFGQGICLSIFSIVMSVIIIILHRSNIGRIIKGTENRIGGKKKG